jgi:hypothetical protein
MMANVRHDWLDKWAFVRCGNYLKLSSDGGDSGSKKCKRGYGGVWRNLRLAGVSIQNNNQEKMKIKIIYSKFTKVANMKIFSH